MRGSSKMFTQCNQTVVAHQFEKEWTHFLGRQLYQTVFVFFSGRIFFEGKTFHYSGGKCPPLRVEPFFKTGFSVPGSEKLPTPPPTPPPPPQTHPLVKYGKESTSILSRLKKHSTYVISIWFSHRENADVTLRLWNEPYVTKRTLDIRAVWSESSLGTVWIDKDSKFLQANHKDYDQTARMISMIYTEYAVTALRVYPYLLSNSII